MEPRVACEAGVREEPGSRADRRDSRSGGGGGGERAQQAEEGAGSGETRTGFKGERRLE